MNRDQANAAARKVPDRDLVDRRVGWLAWWLQLGVGFLAGSGVAYEVGHLLFGGSLTDRFLLMPAGGGLVCGALTSFYGNRAWMAPSVFSAGEPAPPRKARAASFLIGAFGIALVVLVLIRHLAAVARSDHKSSIGFDAFLLLVAFVPGFLLVHTLRTGTGFWRFGIVDREETPLMFRVYACLNVAASISLL